MVRIRRKLNDRQRAAMIRRKMAIAARLAAKPRVDIAFASSGDRSAAKNTIIYRVHQKRGAHLSPTAKNIRDIQNDGSVTRHRGQVHRGEQSAVGRMLTAIGVKLADVIAERIAAAGLVDTGNLMNAIKFRIRNG